MLMGYRYWQFLIAEV